MNWKQSVAHMTDSKILLSFATTQAESLSTSEFNPLYRKHKTYHLIYNAVAKPAVSQNFLRAKLYINKLKLYTPRRVL